MCGKLIAKWFCQYPSVYIYCSLFSCLMVMYENKEKKKEKKKRRIKGFMSFLFTHYFFVTVKTKLIIRSGDVYYMYITSFIRF